MGGAGVKCGRPRNPSAAAEGDNHEQAYVRVKLAKMSMSDLKKLYNKMDVDHSLSWDKTTLVDTFMQNLKSVADLATYPTLSFYAAEPEALHLLI